MPKLKPNNPAARMYMIVETMWETQSSASLEDAWKNALGDSGDRVRLLARIGMVHGLPGKIQRQLRLHPDYDKTDMVWWEDMAEGFMGYGLKDPWIDVRQRIPASALRELKQRATTLNRNAPEPYFDDSVLSDLREYVVQLRVLIHTEDQIDTDLVDLLEERLSVIDDLLDDIRIVGIFDSETALKQAAADVEAVTKREEVKLTNQTKQRFGGLTKKVFAALAAYHLLLTEIEHTHDVATTITATIVQTVQETGKLVQLSLPAPREEVDEQSTAEHVEPDTENPDDDGTP